MASGTVRYVWGDHVRTGVREVYAMVGVVRCAIYTAYLGAPEAHTAKLYPKRLLIKGSIGNFDKKEIPKREIYDE